MRRLPLSNLAFLILGASLALALLAGCGNSTPNSTNGTSNSIVGCGSNIGSNTNAAVPSSINVLTYHYDNSRSGQNLAETILIPANVNSTQFGKLGEFSVIGKVDAQPLYLSNVPIPGVGMKNVLYVATEHGCVFAFDADSISGTTAKALWITSTTQSGEVPSDDRNCSQATPEIGITSTPVIDRTPGRNAIYVIAVSKDSSGNYHHRLHALDLATGAELFGGPTSISASYPGTGAGSSGGNVVFDPSQYNERPGLLELNNTIYTTWGSHCDIGAYTSWVMTFNADTLKQTGVLNLTPHGNDGGIWMAGTAPAADSAGNIYFLIGNGTFDTSLNPSGFPSAGDCGNCFVKLSPSLALLDYFTPSNTVALSNADSDLGSGGPLLLPDLMDGTGAVRHLAVGSGKSNPNIYVVDRDNMGKFNSSMDNIYQEIPGALTSGGEFAKPSYFNNTVYYGAVGDNLKAFPISNATLAAAPSSRSAATFGYPGTTPSISANGTSAGIVWAVENAGGGSAILHAYDATNLGREIYNSNQAANGRDQFLDNKFITPMVANGRVYVGTPASVAVFGLLH